MGLQRRPNTANWYYCFQLKGKRYFGSTGTPNKTVALQVEREIRAKAHSNTFLSVTEELLLSVALKRYCDARKGRRGWKGLDSLSRKVFGQNYDTALHQSIGCFGLDNSIMLHQLSNRLLERIVSARRGEGCAEQTIKHEIGLLRATTNEMHRLGYRCSIDISWPRLKTNSRLRYLDFEEEKRLIAELTPKAFLDVSRKELAWSQHEIGIQRMTQDNYDLVIFLLDTGCRYSEAATIPWSSIDLEARTINLYRSKVQNESFCYMTDRLFTILSQRKTQQRKGQIYLFENKACGPRGYATCAIRKAILRSGLNKPETVMLKGGRVTLHTLRHTFASKLVREGVSLYDVSVLLGHSDSKMTQRYAHLAPSQASSRAVKVLDRLGSSPYSGGIAA